MAIKKLVGSKFKSLAKLSNKFPRNFYRAARVIILLSIAVGLGYLARPLLFAASVNGQLVSRLELIKQLEKEAGAQTLDNLITKALIFQEAKSKGVNVSQQEIDTEISNIEGLVSQQGTTLDDALALQNQTRGDLVEQIRIQKTVEVLLGDEIVVSEEEIASYFEENQEFFEEGSTLEENSQQIRSQLMQEKLSASYQSWIGTLRQNANIKYFADFN